MSDAVYAGNWQLCQHHARDTSSASTLQSQALVHQNGICTSKRGKVRSTKAYGVIVRLECHDNSASQHWELKAVLKSGGTTSANMEGVCLSCLLPFCLTFELKETCRIVPYDSWRLAAQSKVSCLLESHSCGPDSNPLIAPAAACTYML